MDFKQSREKVKKKGKKYLGHSERNKSPDMNVV
jgi:hypothetical protein